MSAAVKWGQETLTCLWASILYHSKDGHFTKTRKKNCTQKKDTDIEWPPMEKDASSSQMV